ncbi:MAG: hypothetical protein NT068_01735 [Candidatus Nomurabacteria bacterium]|nr:hypothetical protein [Candidatus Nomurabacteria bacterium]
MRTPEVISSKLRPLVKSKYIVSYEVFPTHTFNLVKCKIFFPYQKLSGLTELEVSFFWNINEKKAEDEIDYSTYYNCMDFQSFLKKHIEDRKRGEYTELRVYRLVKQIHDITPYLRVLKVLKGSEYADNKLKVDLWISVSYDFKGKFDSINGTFCSMVGIQIKNSKKGQDNHKSKNPFIPSIIAAEYMQDEFIIDKLKLLILNSSKFKTRQLSVNFLEDLNKESDKKSIEYIRNSIIYAIQHLHV